MLGVQVTGSLPPAFPLPGRYSASAGHTVEWRSVGYQWELTGVLDLELWRCERGAVYLRTGARFVTVDPQARVSRGDFTDVRAQGGVRFARGGRSLDAFLAYEHRHDGLLLVPSVRDRALLGLRVGFAPEGSGTPSLPLGWPGAR